MKNMISLFKNGVSTVATQLKKNSPELLIVAGVIGTVTSAVLVGKATLKVNDVLDKAKADVESIHKVEADEAHPEYTEEDSKKDLLIVYAQTGWKLTKLYAPAIILGVSSISCMVFSNNILRKRNAALMAACSSLGKEFGDYRNRVIERFGKDMDRELHYGIKAKQIEETVVDEDGIPQKVTKDVEVIDPNAVSPYAKFFDEGSKYWEKNPEYNLMFLRAQQAYLNDLLKARPNHTVFLNEAYELLGIPQTQEGQIYGWHYDKKHPVGDNFIDFGIYDIYKEKNRDFVNGYERSILLDFNVDGKVVQYI